MVNRGRQAVVVVVGAVLCTVCKVPQAICHLQGDPVLELVVQAAVLVLKECVQRAQRGQFHDKHVTREHPGSQQTHQTGVVQTTQYC